MDALGSFQTVPVLIRRISDSDLTSYCQMISVNYIFSVSQSDSGDTDYSQLYKYKYKL